MLSMETITGQLNGVVDAELLPDAERYRPIKRTKFRDVRSLM